MGLSLAAGSSNNSSSSSSIARLHKPHHSHFNHGSKQWKHQPIIPAPQWSSAPHTSAGSTHGGHVPLLAVQPPALGQQPHAGRSCSSPVCANNTPADLTRRQTLQATALHALSATLLPSTARASVPAEIDTSSSPTATGNSAAFNKLLQRATTGGDVVSPGNSLWSKPGLMLYPRWLFGEYDVSSTFSSFRLPLGERYVAQALLNAARAPADQGGVGSTATYSMKWFSTLPNTLGNQLRFALGSLPEDAVVQDRAYNMRQMTNAYMGYEAVEYVEYEPREAPDRASVQFSRLTPDMRPLPPRKAELYVNNSQTAEGVLGTESTPAFVTSELLRQVLVGVRSVEVQDYEVINLYELLDKDVVRVRNRTAIYLEPRDELYFTAAGRAVAVYDYDIIMRRRPAPLDAPQGATACVTTPKAVTQCV